MLPTIPIIVLFYGIGNLVALAGHHIHHKYMAFVRQQNVFKH
jgi:hypothetical protein